LFVLFLQQEPTTRSLCAAALFAVLKLKNVEKVLLAFLPYIHRYVMGAHFGFTHSLCRASTNMKPTFENADLIPHDQVKGLQGATQDTVVCPKHREKNAG
jgi:hypothetical protein